MTTRLHRLVSDVKRLEQYIARMEQKGKLELIDKLSTKKNYLTQQIAECEDQTV